MRQLETNALFEFSHPNKGTWYFTNLNKAAEALEAPPSGLKFTWDKSKKRQYKDWTIRLKGDCGEVPFKFVNPTKKDIEMTWKN